MFLSKLACRRRSGILFNYINHKQYNDNCTAIAYIDRLNVMFDVRMITVFFCSRALSPTFYRRRRRVARRRTLDST